MMLAWLLNRFANWVVRTRPLGDYETSSTPTGFAAYVIRDYVTGEPYITRVLFPRVFGVRFMLHRIHRPDADRALHNHPWRWARSLILTGSYDEERGVDGGTWHGPIVHTRRVRWFNKLTDQDFHRITKLHGEVWTLFVTGERVQEWGFLDDDGWFTPWREYIEARKDEHAREVIRRPGESDDELRVRLKS